MMEETTIPSEIQEKLNTIYVGIDFHKDTSTICMKDYVGKVIEKMTVSTDDLINTLAPFKSTKIAIETTGGSNHIVQKLRDEGHVAVLANTNKTKAIGHGGKKNDDIDSDVLTDLLRTDFLPEVHLKSISSREIKTILVQREYLVRARVNMTNHIRGILREYGIVIEVGVKSFYRFVGQAIPKIPNTVIRKRLEKDLEYAISLKQDEEELERELINHCQEHCPDISSAAQRLQTIPGVGLLTAYLIIAIADGISRFPEASKWGAYLGLTPKEFASADMKKMGPITRSGCELLRRFLIHGARAVLKTAHLKKDRGNLEHWALRKKKKIGMNKATVALAHKLARISYGVLQTGGVYNKNYKHKKTQSLAA